MKYLLVIVAILLGGCATLRPAELPHVTNVQTNLITSDLRGKDQSETEVLSYIITNCKYGIQRLGDEWTKSNKVDYLSSKISEQLPSKSNLIVNDFVTYFNMQYLLREGNIYKGAIWELVECDDNTDKFTSYTPEENPERFNIIIGTLSGSLDGKPFSERVTSFPICPEGVKECTSWDAQANSIKEIVVQLAEKVVLQNKELTNEGIGCGKAPHQCFKR